MNASRLRLPTSALFSSVRLVSGPGGLRTIASPLSLAETLRALARGVLGTVLALLAGAAAAQDTTGAPLGGQITALLAARVDPAGPGVAVLVARGDELLFRGARGMASIELGVPLSPDDVFRIGSITKQFAAATLLRQIEAGRAALGDPLSKFLPDYPNGGAITLAQLLNHTSGVKSYTSIPGYMHDPVRRDLGTAALIDQFKNLPADFAPGASWAYDNSGYVLVGAVIEAITDKPWHQALAETTAPLGLAHTVWGDNSRIVPHMAEGYSTGPGGAVSRAEFVSMTQPHAAGGLLSTVDDLWRWNQALHGGRVLSPESYHRMTTPEGAPAEGAHYGYGLMTGTLRGRPTIFHGGGIHGFLSMLLYVPASRLTVVVLRNSDGPGLDPGALARQIGALALGQPFPDGPAVAVPPAELQALAGRYRKQGSPAGAVEERVLRVRGATLTSERSGGSAFVLRPVGGGVYLFEGSLARIEVAPGLAPVASLRFFPDGEGEGETWVRVSGAPADRAEIALDAAQQQAVLGDYIGTGFRFKVFLDAQGVLRGQAPGQSALRLYAQGPRRLYVKEVDAQFELTPGEPDGPVTGMTLTQGGVRLQLQRQPPGPTAR